MFDYKYSFIAEWWAMFGIETPTLRKLVMRIIFKTASSSACERNWSIFALMHTKKWNLLAYKRLEQLVYCTYDMQLLLRDRKDKYENNDRRDPLDIIETSMHAMGDDVEEYILLEWIRPVHLDNENQQPDPRITSQARSEGIDVERVLSEEVGVTLSDETMMPTIVVVAMLARMCLVVAIVVVVMIVAAVSVVVVDFLMILGL